MPRVIRVNPVAPEAELVREAADTLRGGGLVAFPTETVYGLGARGLSDDDVRRLFVAKGRPANHPLILHFTSRAHVEEIAGPLSGAAARLADALWPGPLTLVVPRAAQVSRLVTADLDTMAVRVPRHPIALALVRALGEPIAAPSANAHTGISPTSAAHVVRSLGDAVDLVLDGGEAPAGIESSVVDVTVDPPRLLRPGSASIAELRALAPDLEWALRGAPAADALRPSPGMSARHYAPRARLAIAPIASLKEAARAARSRGVTLAAIVWSDEAKAHLSADPSAGALIDCVYMFPGDAPSYGAKLYAALHDVDERGCTELFVEEPPAGDAWLAVHDRLRRASTEA